MKEATLSEWLLNDEHETTTRIGLSPNTHPKCWPCRVHKIRQVGFNSFFVEHVYKLDHNLFVNWIMIKTILCSFQTPKFTMGRKKIAITRIQDERNRQVIYCLVPDLSWATSILSWSLRKIQPHTRLVYPPSLVPRRRGGGGERVRA